MTSRQYRNEILETVGSGYTPLPGWFPCRDCGAVFYTRDKRRNRNCGRGKCASLRKGTDAVATFKPDKRQKTREQKA